MSAFRYVSNDLCISGCWLLHFYQVFMTASQRKADAPPAEMNESQRKKSEDRSRSM